MHHCSLETIGGGWFLLPGISGGRHLVGVQQGTSEGLRGALQNRDDRRDPSYSDPAHLPESTAPRVNPAEQHLAALFRPDCYLSDELQRPQERGVRTRCQLVDIRLLLKVILALLRVGVAVTVPEQKAGELIVRVPLVCCLRMFLSHA